MSTDLLHLFHALLIVT